MLKDVNPSIADQAIGRKTGQLTHRALLAATAAVAVVPVATAADADAPAAGCVSFRRRIQSLYSSIWANTRASISSLGL